MVTRKKMSAIRPSQATAKAGLIDNEKEKNSWVQQGAVTEVTMKAPTRSEPEKMKRLSLDLTATMHKNLMLYCVQHDRKAADVLRELIEEKLKEQ